jgi:phosphohistidine phosphatase
METKRLALLRHAKSSWDDASLADRDRPLSPRGRRAATRIGRYLRDEGMVPELVLCSSSSRTRQTLDRLELDGRVEISIEDELYGASAGDLLRRVRRIGEPVTTALVIAHNPGIQDLAASLASDPAPLASFPTAALADLRVAVGTWEDVAPGGAVLHGFITPRELE